MITPQTIGNILYRDSKALGIEPVYVVLPGDNSDEIPSGEVKEERVVIHVKKQKAGTYWRKSFNEVNILVPRIANRPDRIRLEQLEQEAMELFDGATGEYAGAHYLYSVESIGSMTDAALRCEYVNCRILFEVLNVK